MKLLIVGPDAQAKADLARKLEAEGYRVATAPFGDAGAALAESPWNACVLAAGGDAKSGEIPPLDEIERRYIQLVLDETHFNMSRTSRLLGIDRTTLYNKLRKYGIRREPEVAAQSA